MIGSWEEDSWLQGRTSLPHPSDFFILSDVMNSMYRRVQKTHMNNGKITMWTSAQPQSRLRDCETTSPAPGSPSKSFSLIQTSLSIPERNNQRPPTMCSWMARFCTLHKDNHCIHRLSDPVLLVIIIWGLFICSCLSVHCWRVSHSRTGSDSFPVWGCDESLCVSLVV